MSTPRFMTAAVMAAAIATPALAQEARPVAKAVEASEQPPARPVTRQLIPVELQVNIVKYQGEKRISSIPFVLALNALAGGVIGNSTERTQVTIGSEVPVPTTTFATANDKTAQPLRSFNYRNVGTVMSAAAVTAEGGQFEIDLSVDESSVGTNAFDSRGGSPAEMPVFKSFKARNRMLLRPGQMRQFTAATDRISGETIRIEVTITVVK